MMGLDYSAGRPRASEVKRLGYDFVIRYCGQPGNRKNATPAEVADMLAHGVAVALVFESTAARAGQGFNAGVADARAAVVHQAALGIPASRPIYYAVDYDANPADVEPYFRGVNSVPGPDSAYGSFRVVRRLRADGLTVDSWQTVAWSKGQVDPGLDVFQRLGQVTVDGVVCDENEAKTADFGQYPFEEGDMQQSDPSYVAKPGGGYYDLGEVWRWTNEFANQIPGLGAGVAEVKSMLATVIANQSDDLNAADVLARVDQSVRAATTQALTETVLPAIARIEAALAADDTAKAQAIVTELAERLRPAA